MSFVTRLKFLQVLKLSPYLPFACWLTVWIQIPSLNDPKPEFYWRCAIAIGSADNQTNIILGEIISSHSWLMVRCLQKMAFLCLWQVNLLHQSGIQSFLSSFCPPGLTALWDKWRKAWKFIHLSHRSWVNTSIPLCLTPQLLCWFSCSTSYQLLYSCDRDDSTSSCENLYVVASFHQC